jgi:hypothetical protein
MNTRPTTSYDLFYDSNMGQELDVPSILPPEDSALTETAQTIAMVAANLLGPRILTRPNTEFYTRASLTRVTQAVSIARAIVAEVRRTEN